MNKKIFSKLVFGILLCVGILCFQQETVQASVYLDMDRTVITEDNAVVSVMVYPGGVPDEAITIIVKKNGEEIKCLRTEVDTYKTTLYTYDFKKDLGLSLEKDCLYEYAVIEDSVFYEECYASGQFYTGTDVYATIYMINQSQSTPTTERIFRSECITGLTAGDSFHYTAEWSHDQGRNMEYSKGDPSGPPIDKYESEYDIEVLSEDSSENVIYDYYSYYPLPSGLWDFGGLYLKDSESGQRIGLDILRYTFINVKTIYVPEDVICRDGQYYMYDAKKTGGDIVVYDRVPFYQNLFDVYYKRCPAPTTQTSVIVNYINTAAGNQIHTETIPNLPVGGAYTYTPKSTFSDEKYNYEYFSEAPGNILTLDKLWTNPENNIVTVYYQPVSEVVQPKKANKTEIKKLEKSKPVIKKLQKKSQTSCRLKFSKVSKADGYEILYSTGSSFKKASKKKAAGTDFILKKLKKGKTYYVKVRAYKKIDGKIYRSKYSAKKKVTL